MRLQPEYAFGDCGNSPKPPFDTQDSVTARRRWAGIALGLALMLAVSFVVPAIRRLVLRAAGWALVTSDPVKEKAGQQIGSNRAISVMRTPENRTAQGVTDL